MTNQQKSSNLLHITLWVAQVVLAACLVAVSIMKFQPIEKISVMMPWTGQVPTIVVRLTGLFDLSGAIGLILPSLLRIKPKLTPWAAIGCIALAICGAVFHILRGEASIIGVNIFVSIIAAFIAWGRFKGAPITSK
ncbi:MAG TPA: DoxX family protein [Cyclobacteriaceae bacterium]